MIIFRGSARFAYRDPACVYHNGTYYLFFTVSEKWDGYMYSCVGVSKSHDLTNWSEPRLITEKALHCNYCSPGNVIERNGAFVLCFTSYPMPYPYEKCCIADQSARLFTVRTKDFRNYTEPQLLNPKGETPEAELGRMIDPFILPHDGGYYLFFKQNGVSHSYSRDLVHWEFLGSTSGGENACVLRQEDRFILVHSPKNGIAFAASADLKQWEPIGFTTLEQDHWAWANGRITAGFAMEAPGGFPCRYLLFFHGSENVYPETHGNATLGLAFTDDFQTYYYEL